MVCNPFPFSSLFSMNNNVTFDLFCNISLNSGSLYTFPNSNYYEQVYEPQFTVNYSRAMTLYYSECLGMHYIFIWVYFLI